MTTKNRHTSCPNSGIVMIGTPPQIVGEKTKRYLYQAPCDRWDCPYCGNIKRMKWGVRIEYGIKFYDEYSWDFLTITSHRKLTTFEATVAVWPNAWQKLSNRLRYAYKPEYALVPERHKDGRLHAHILFGTEVGHMSKSWLKKSAVKSGLGYMVDVQAVKGATAAAFYVTKYLTKSMNDNAWPVNFRRVRVSQGWPEPPPRDDFEPLEADWKALPDRRIADVKSNLESRGIEVHVLGREQN